MNEDNSIEVTETGDMVMSAGAREALTKAKAVADTAYEEWVDKTSDDRVAWQEIGYGAQPGSKLNPQNLVDFTKDNWGKVVAVATAFGIPLGVADIGAFKGVLNVMANFWPF